MLMSTYLLNATYTKAQYAGAGVVLLGIAVVLAPSFLQPTDTSDPNNLLWISILVLSCIPMCLSSIYKEKVCIRRFVL